MNIMDSVRKTGVTIEASATIREAAVAMEAAAVGALAVLDDGRLVGIVTDRDLVCRGLARDVEADARIDSMMSTPVITIDATADLRAAYRVFGTEAIRRLPIVDNGAFVGMLTVDDLLVDLTADLADIARPVGAEVLFGHRDSQVPTTD